MICKGSELSALLNYENLGSDEQYNRAIIGTNSDHAILLNSDAEALHYQ